MVFQTKNLTFRIEDFDPDTGSLRNLPRAMCEEVSILILYVDF